MACLNIRFADTYKGFIKDFLNNGHTRYSLYGGRDSGKSYALYQLELLTVMTSGCVMVVRRYYKDIKGSCFNGILKVISDLHLEKHFIINRSPLMVTCIKTGYIIDFAGLDDPNKIKSKIAPKGSYKLLVFEEAEEIKQKEHCDEVISTFERGDNSTGFKALWIFNPPPSKNHWTNREMRETDNTKDLLALHVNYYDIPKEWVGQQYDEIERIKKYAPKLYRYRYLGEAISAEDQVFENIRIESIPQNMIDYWENNDDWVFNGLDFGYHPDPNAGVTCHYDENNRTLYIYREFYQGKLNNQQISDGLEKAGFSRDYRIYADSADPKTINDLYTYGWNIRAVSKSRVAEGFHWLQGLNAIIIDKERCPNAAMEFSEYFYELDRTGSISESKLYKWDQADHMLAAVRYALNDIIRTPGI